MSKGKKILSGVLSFAKGVIAPLNPVAGLAIGAVDGLVSGVKKEKDKNLASPTGGEGKPDYSHLAGVAVFVLLVIGFVTGLITMEQMKQLLKMFMGMN